MIDVATIVSPAFVHPVFCEHSPLPTCRYPDWKDRFWYMERRYTDCAGWDDVTIGQETRIREEEVDITLPEGEGEGMGYTIIDSSSDEEEEEDSENDS